MRKGLIILTAILVLLFFYSCGKKEPEAEGQAAQSKQEQKIKGQEPTSKTEEPTPEPEEEESPKMEKDPMAAMKEFTEKVKKESEKQAGGKITVADKATLTSALRPVSGWEMQEPRYSKSSMGGITVSKIETEYTKNGKKIEVMIDDAGTAQSALVPFKMAISLGMTKEDDEGYQRIFEYKGDKGIEEYFKQSDQSEITFIYKERYIITLTSYSGLTTDDLKDFLKKLDLSKLD